MLNKHRLLMLVAFVTVSQVLGGNPEPTAAAPDRGLAVELNQSKELTQLRNAWLLERKMSLVRLDVGYYESLVALRERAKDGRDDAALALVEQELEDRKAQFEEAKSEMPTTPIAVSPKASFQKGEVALLVGKLVGRVWRVDHEGEGLRWYYFAEDGSLARKSRITDWVWTDLSGSWRMDPRGVIEIRCKGSAAQVLIGEQGKPVIAINRDGALSQRPLVITDLDYPGPGKE